MAQLQNQNTHKMAPRGEKENGAILAGTCIEFRQLKKNHPTLKWEGRWRNSFWAKWQWQSASDETQPAGV